MVTLFINQKLDTEIQSSKEADNIFSKLSNLQRITYKNIKEPLHLMMHFWNWNTQLIVHYH